MPFIFYDTETTGVDTAFDQVLQFAAIKTDDDFVELDRFNFRCRLQPHVVPSPGAVLVTGVTIDQLLDASLPSHYEMIRAIRARFTPWGPATYIGYNSIRFDEELLRQALYQTLHDPYFTSMHGNMRADAMHAVQAASLFAPNAIAIPLDDRGRQSFKLERVAPANGFDHSNAHDALADVEATIHMCRLVRERAEQVWAGLMRATTKAKVVDLVDHSERFALGEFYFGRGSARLVTPIGQNPQDSGQLLFFDLGVDPEAMRELSDEDLSSALARSPKPVRRLRANRNPILLDGELLPERPTDLPPTEIERRIAILREDVAFRDRLIRRLLADQEPFVSSPHVEKQIYERFLDRREQAQLDMFHGADWMARYAMLGDISDTRLKALGRRLTYIERPEALPDEVRNDVARKMTERLMSSDPELPWLTLPRAIQEADKMIDQLNGPDAHRIAGLKAHLQSRVAELSGSSI